MPSPQSLRRLNNGSLALESSRLAKLIDESPIGPDSRLDTELSLPEIVVRIPNLPPEDDASESWSPLFGETIFDDDTQSDVADKSSVQQPRGGTRDPSTGHANELAESTSGEIDQARSDAPTRQPAFLPSTKNNLPELPSDSSIRSDVTNSSVESKAPAAGIAESTPESTSEERAWLDQLLGAIDLSVDEQTESRHDLSEQSQQEQNVSEITFAKTPSAEIDQQPTTPDDSPQQPAAPELSPRTRPPDVPQSIAGASDQVPAPRIIADSVDGRIDLQDPESDSSNGGESASGKQRDDASPVLGQSLSSDKHAQLEAKPEKVSPSNAPSAPTMRIVRRDEAHEGASGTAVPQRAHLSDTAKDRATATNQYESLVNRLLDNELRGDGSLLLFSAAHEEKSTSDHVERIANSLARKKSGARILLVDAKMKTRVLSTRLSAQSSVGLAEAIHQGRDWRDMLVPARQSGVSFLPAGNGLLSHRRTTRQRMLDITTELRGAFDLVVIDGGESDGILARLLCPFCDATYLLVTLGLTHAHEAKAAVTELRAYGARLLGCVAAG